MALVVFESRVNMLTVATPSIGGFILAYDSVDGVLKQKNDQGVISAIAGSTPVGSLSQTLAIGNSTGTFSINLGANTKISSVMGGGQLRLDNGIGGANIVNLSTDYGALAQSYLYMNSNSTTLRSVNASLSLSTSVATFQLNTGNVSSFSLNNYYITLNSNKVLTFTTATASTGVGNKISALISTNNSKLGPGVYNTVVLGGTGITGATSNSVYVPNLYVQDGGFIKGTSGLGQLSFNSDGEVYISSNDNIIGVLSANSAVMAVNNGIFISDSIDTITTISTSMNTFISTSNTTIDQGLNNVVVIGGDTLSITQSNTTYIGGSVSIGNSYILPSTDGISGQVIQTDGMGNTYWGNGGNLVEITAASFSALNGTFKAGTTYKILDADTFLYGGTEIYLTTNSSGILNETGVGKFYNPKYDQGIPGFGIWVDSASYAVDDIVIWGGMVWVNTTGSNSLNIDLFTLNSDDWDVIPFNNPASTFYYNIAYNEIKYDWQNDLIIYRNEKNSNIVECTVDTILYFIDYIGYSPIKVFQWGNTYDYNTGYGIGEQIILNSYNENINFKGTYQTSIKMSNGSHQTNINFDVNSYQDTITLSNYSYQDGLYFTASNQYKISLDNSSYQESLYFNSSYQDRITLNSSNQEVLSLYSSFQQYITLSHGSYNSNLVLTNSIQYYFTFNNNSYQSFINLYNFQQSHLIFDDNSAQINLSATASEYINTQHSLKLDKFYWDRLDEIITSNEEDLYLTGNNLSYRMPQDEGVKGELVFFGKQSADFSPGYLYSFNGGTWSYADSSATASIIKYQLLGIAKGTKVSDGLLVRGYAQFNIRSYTDMTLGHSQYVRSTGNFSDESPGVGNYIRSIGYCVDTSGYGTLYFCPDTYYKII